MNSDKFVLELRVLVFTFILSLIFHEAVDVLWKRLRKTAFATAQRTVVIMTLFIGYFVFEIYSNWKYINERACGSTPCDVMFSGMTDLFAWTGIAATSTRVAAFLVGLCSTWAFNLHGLTAPLVMLGTVFVEDFDDIVDDVWDYLPLFGLHTPMMSSSVDNSSFYPKADEDTNDWGGPPHDEKGRKNARRQDSRDKDRDGDRYPGDRGRDRGRDRDRERGSGNDRSRDRRYNEKGQRDGYADNQQQDHRQGERRNGRERKYKYGQYKSKDGTQRDISGSIPPWVIQVALAVIAAVVLYELWRMWKTSATRSVSDSVDSVSTVGDLSAQIFDEDDPLISTRPRGARSTHHQSHHRRGVHQRVGADSGAAMAGHVSARRRAASE
eukprot:GFYU01003663.1.p1 GENE.GFYU01003663.1~~GFYU01003663.1.p1  ORF type:complete len:382 (-),score=36.01 GFYU01003663.1:62-1207(-)